jgi:hypothetical protein
VTLGDTILFVGCLFVFIIVCLFFKSFVSTQTWATRSTGSTWNQDHAANLDSIASRTLASHTCSIVELRELCKVVENLNITISCMLLRMQIFYKKDWKISYLPIILIIVIINKTFLNKQKIKKKKKEKKR